MLDPAMTPLTAEDRRDKAVEFACELIRDSQSALSRNDLFHALERHFRQWDLGRTQWYRYVAAAQAQIAEECAEDNPRDVDAQRRAMLKRHERMSSTLERAMYYLVPDDPDELRRDARSENFFKDVEAACKVSRQVIEHDKLRAHLLRLGDYAPDVAAVSAEARERNVKLIQQAMVDMTAEERERIVAAAERAHDEAEGDALRTIGDPHERS